MSKGEFQPKSHHWEMLRGCKSKENGNKIPIFDVDDGKVDFVTVDTAESSHKCSRRFGKSSWKDDSTINNLIDIDDAESSRDHEQVCSDNDAMSRTSPSPAISHIVDGDDGDNDENSDGDDDECVVFVKGKTGQEDKLKKVDFGACSRSVFQETDGFFVNGMPVGNSYELSSSESDTTDHNEVETVASDDDSSDCEIIDDFSRNIREEWERAASKRRVQDTAENMPDYSTGKSRNVFSEKFQAEVNVQDDAYNPSSCGRQLDDDTLPFHLNTGNGRYHFYDETEFMEDPSFLQKKFSFAFSDYGGATPFEAVDEFGFKLPSFSDGADACNQELKQSFLSSDTTDQGRQPIRSEKENLESCDYIRDKPLEMSKSKVDETEGGCTYVQDSEIERKKEFLESCDYIRDKPLETSNNRVVDDEAKGGCNNVQDSEIEHCNSQIGNFVIGDRERHKESEEFKRASEEEWIARQEQLRIQAEEARRMRKRKKAENMRLLDMERRQKQRLKEVRESQKKNEETINLKEQLRMEVRKQLDLIELQYTDMASLLRSLGIHVGGGHLPSSREVNIAYKQALLRFHPDRASKTDIREQVEAEEKFKLVSRLKEKLLQASH